MRRQRWTSKPGFAKSISIKSGKRRSDGYARKAAGITPGDLFGVAETRLGSSRGGLTAGQKSAEGVVVRQRMKARTKRSGE